MKHIYVTGHGFIGNSKIDISKKVITYVEEGKLFNGMLAREMMEKVSQLSLEKYLDEYVAIVKKYNQGTLIKGKGKPSSPEDEEALVVHEGKIEEHYLCCTMDCFNDIPKPEGKKWVETKGEKNAQLLQLNENTFVFRTKAVGKVMIRLSQILSILEKHFGKDEFILHWNSCRDLQTSNGVFSEKNLLEAVTEADYAKSFFK